MKILFTGFEAAPGATESPSWNWISDLAEVAGETHLVSALQLPLMWDECFSQLRVQLNQGWDAVIVMGSRAGEGLTIERIAMNENSVSCKDARGRRPRAKVIDKDGEPGYWSGLPYRELGIVLTESRIPTSPSHNPGGGLANHVFYQLMNWIALSRRELVGGLIHVPESGALSSPDLDTRRSFIRALESTLTRSAERADSLSVNLDRFGATRGDSRESPKP